MLESVRRSRPLQPGRPGSPRRLGRYTVGARCYDALSVERPLYPGRLAAVADLAPGTDVDEGAHL